MKNYNDAAIEKAIALYKKIVSVLQQPVQPIPISATDGLLLIAIVFTTAFAVGAVLLTGKPI